MANNNNLSNIVYYNDDHSKSPKCTTELSIINGATWTLPSTWQELSQEIEQGDKIVFHIDMITKSGESIKDFIKSVYTITKFIPGHKLLKILVLTTPTTTQQQVQELKDANILGIGYDTTYYSFEQAAEATAALIANKPYWPEHIISQLPVEEKKPLSVYFRSDWKTYITDIVDVTELSNGCPWEIKYCATWDELGDVLKEEPHQLIFHTDMVTNADVTIHEFISMIETLIKLVSPDKTIPIGVGIESTTNLKLVKELQKLNIHGIIPSVLGFGIYEAKQGYSALFNRIPYWPKHILQQLPGAIKPINKNSIILTPRQVQVANLILERGLGNKKIAQALNITESTVKIHVSAILKAYGVRTRTQLVVMSK